MNRSRLITVVIVLAVVLTAGFLYNKYRVAPEVNLQNLDLTDLDGHEVSWQSFSNKKLFLNFFATWCGPCVREMPSLQAAQDKLQNDNFQFICISDEPVELLKQFSAALNMHLLVLHSSKKLSSLNIVTYPTNYIINAKGVIVFKNTGDRDWSTDESIEVIKQKEN